MIVLGLDLSLTATGFSAMDGGKQLGRGVIKSKPQGKKPIDEIRRMNTIVEQIIAVIVLFSPELVVIEGLAFMAKGTSLVQLGGLNYIVRRELLHRGIKFVIVAPTSLKKFITGRGVAQKDEMMLAVFKKYGVTILENNENDAYCLSRVGTALMETDPKITIAQKEVIKLLSSQIE